VTPILTLPLKASATRLLGFESTSLVFATYYITGNFDLNLRRLVNGAARLGPVFIAIVDRLILIWALLRFDVFHYFFDRGIMRSNGRFGIRLEELELLQSAGKRVYGFAYGADVRLRAKTLALGRWNFCADCPAPLKFCVCDDRTGRSMLGEVSARLTASVALGDMCAYLPGVRNVNYWPIDLERLPPAQSPQVDGPLRIAHAPNHTHFKGSSYLESVIDKLKAEGYAIEYVKVQGVPNEEVMRIFGEVDLVADQFIGGAYGYTALEAMARRKPVLTYVRDPDLVVAPAECPVINVTPDTLEDALRWCIENRSALITTGAAGQAYVARWHTIEAVAARLAGLYLDTGDFPKAVTTRLATFQDAEASRRASLAVATDWHHPWTIQ
jgi:hypothetical protein